VSTRETQNDWSSTVATEPEADQDRPLLTLIFDSLNPSLTICPSCHFIVFMFCLILQFYHKGTLVGIKTEIRIITYYQLKCLTIQIKILKIYLNNKDLIQLFLFHINVPTI